MLIQKKNSILIKTFEIILTGLGWIFLILFLLILVSNVKWKLNGSMDSLSLVNSITIILFTVATSIISFLGLYFWGIFNKKRYGLLNRRTFPKSTETLEIATYYSMSQSDVLKLQHENYIER
jgi:poly-beta-1,6-N-acetyl-D-glucosamine biosynthesis protein PgaD